MNEQYRKIIRIRKSPDYLLASLIDTFLSSQYLSEEINSNVDLLSGYAFKSDWFSEEGMSLLRNINVKPQRLDWTDKVLLKNELIYKFRSFELEEGDIVFSMDGSVSNEGVKIAIINKDDLPCYLLQRVCRLKTKVRLNSRFLFWMLQTSRFIDYILSSNRSIAISHISAEQILRYEIPIPPIKIQKEIALFFEDNKSKLSDSKLEQILTKILKLYSERREFNNSLEKSSKYVEKLRHAILQEAVSGKLVPQDQKTESAEEQLRNTIENRVISYKRTVQNAISESKRIPKKPKNIQFWEKNTEIFFHESETPKNWASTYFMNLCLLQRGFDLPRHQFRKGNYPVASSGGIMGYHSEFRVKGPGVFTGRSGSVGKVYYIDSDYWPHNTTLFVKDFNGNNPKYVYYALKAYGIENESSSTAVATLNRNKLFKMKILIPPFNEQVRIANKIEESMMLCDELEQKIKENRRNSELLMEVALKEAYAS